MRGNRISTSAIRVLLPLSLAMAGGADADPAEPLCEDPAPWSEYRFIAEKNLASDDFMRPEEFSDPSLVETVEQYFDAWEARDTGRLLEFRISLSNAHLKVEEQHLVDAIETVRFFRHRVHSLIVDESNPWHVWVYTAVVVRSDGHCLEDGVLTEWIRLQEDWFTFPSGQLVHNAAKKGRPNRGYRSASTASPEAGYELQQASPVVDGAERP